MRLLAVTLVGLAGLAEQTHPYVSPDHALEARIVPVGKEKEYGNPESRVEILSNHGKLLSTVDYSSTDGEHGFAVVNAEWSADSQFFVYSLESSGGHQPWHSPTYFYSRKNNRIVSLDDYVGLISGPEFTLVAPDTVQAETWNGRNIKRINVTLSALLKSKRTHPSRLR